MLKKMGTYTVIDNTFMKEQNLLPYEYMVLDTIYRLSNNDVVKGYCYASKQYIANALGLSRKHVITIISKMEARGFVERGDSTYVKPTKKWNSLYKPIAKHADKYVEKQLNRSYKKNKTKLNTVNFEYLQKFVETLSYTEFIASRYWGQVRLFVIKRDGKKCTKCGGNRILQVHHLNYKHFKNEHNHLEDLITLCKTCHTNLHKNTVVK